MVLIFGPARHGSFRLAAIRGIDSIRPCINAAGSALFRRRPENALLTAGRRCRGPDANGA